MESRVSQPMLFSPFKMRGVVASNRTVVSPMVQYRATDGLVNDYHLVHLGKFALGKFGIIFTENCAVVPEGRVTQGDLGMWDDGQIEGHKRLTRFLKQEGALAATQITHAGRKASSPRQFDKPDEFGPKGANWQRWQVYGPSALSAGERYSESPMALDAAQMKAGADKEALRAFERALDIDAHTAPAQLNLGDVRRSQGDLARAGFGDAGLGYFANSHDSVDATGQAGGIAKLGDSVAASAINGIFYTYTAASGSTEPAPQQGAGKATRLLLKDILVLGVGAATGQTDQAAQVPSALMTLSVTQSEAERLILSTQTGTIYFALMNDQSDVTESGGVAETNIFR